ncbi:MAG: AAA family ATPase [Candidatus Margulisiibacteriota bacterium]
MDFHAFDQVRAIYEDSAKQLFCAYEKRENRHVLIKTYKRQLSQQDLALLDHEATVLERLNLPGTLKAYPKTSATPAGAYLFEGFEEAVTLKQWIAAQPQPPSLAVFFKMAIEWVDILVHLHASGIAHRNLSAYTVLIHPETLGLKLIGFEYSSPIELEENEDIATSFRGVLSYMAPEQSGRMNATASYRSDFYSLGITLFELLTGHLPFTETKPMDIIYAHVAKTPPLPDDLRLDVPESLSDILSKCLAKNSKDRYKSAYGLKRDLEACQSQLANPKKNGHFVIGQYDHQSHFAIQKNLYGREKEMGLLLGIFNKALHEKPQCVFIAGESGIGKTSLVYETRKPLAEQHGYFTKGKFDQFEKTVPYSGIIKAMQDLVSQWVEEGAESVARWKSKLAPVVQNAQVLIDVIPELELILGPQAPLETLDSSDAQLRFHLEFQKFIQTIAQPESPVVLFLDDLQWADSESLALLEFLLTDQRTRQLLVIGAYRNHAHSDSALSFFIKKLEEQVVPTHHIALSELQDTHITQMIADSFECELSKAQELAKVVWGKTRGNPFFTHQFLKHLYAEKGLVFNVKTGRWEWDLKAIENEEVDIIRFVTTKVKAMPKAVQETLKLASCIGYRFDTALLSIILDKPAYKICQHILNAALKSIVTLQSQDIALLESASRKKFAGSLLVQFTHDKIYEAINRLLSEVEKSEAHFKIGQTLLLKTTPADLEDQVILIMNHLNQSPLSKEYLGNEHVANLNKIAATKSKERGNYTKALELFSYGIAALKEESCWKTQYPLMFSLHLEEAECLYLTKQFEQAEIKFKSLISHANTALDKARVYNIQLVLQVNQNHHRQAFESGLRALALLGISVTSNPGTSHVLWEFAKTKWQLPRKLSPKYAQELQFSADPKIALVIDILTNLTAPAYFINKNLFAYIILKTITVSQKYGHAPTSAYAYAAYGVLLGSVFKQYELGYQFGELAIAFNKRFEDKALACKINFVFGGMISHWTRPRRKSLSYFQAGFEQGRSHGEYIYSAYCALYIVTIHYFNGRCLDEVLVQSETYTDFLVNTKNQDAVLGNAFLKDAIDVLKGRQSAFSSYDKTNMASVNRGTLALHQVITSVFFKEYKKALEYAQEAYTFWDGLTGLPQSMELVFFHSIALSKYAATEAPQEEIKKLKKRLSKNISQLKKWAELCPETLTCRWQLIEALSAQLNGKIESALSLYGMAIAEAKTQGAKHIEAIGNEFLGSLFLSKNNFLAAKAYLTEAKGLYQSWGASAKVNRLVNEYPTVFSEQNANELYWLTLYQSLMIQITDFYDTLKKREQVLEAQITKEISEKKKVLLVAQELAKQAQLSSLTLGIAHEIRNPLSALKGTADNLKDRVLNIMDTNLQLDKSDFPWWQVVSQERLVAILGNKKELGKLAWDWFIEMNYINDQGQINEAIFRPYSPFFELELPESLVPHEKTLSTYLLKTLLYDQVLSALNIFGDESVRVEQICSNMLAYGLSGEGVSRTAFNELVGGQDSEVIWNELVHRGYLDANGMILDAFKPGSKFTLHLSKRFKPFEHAIIDIINGTTKAKKTAIDLNQSLASLASLFSGRFKGQGMAIQHEFANDIPTIMGHGDDLKQTFMNIVNNAFHAMSNAPTKILTIRTLKTDYQGNPMIEVQFEDTGCGIPKDVLPKIMTPFFSTKGVTGGQNVGLGLSIVNQTVQRLGGKILVESEEGKGTTFRLLFPIHRP